VILLGGGVDVVVATNVSCGRIAALNGISVCRTVFLIDS
jgi:hypothetical protein